jgi:CRP-like cAMP-binding protein
VADVTDGIETNVLEPVSSLMVLWRQNPIFAAIEPGILTELVARYRDETLQPRTLILESGAEVEHLYVVLSGTVRVFHRSPDGREAVVKLLRAPAVFAELELLHDLRMLESVDTIDEVRLARIPGQEYIELLHRYPEAMFAHLKHLAAAFCVAARNEQQVFARLEQRIANLLLSYADADADDQELTHAVELPVELSQGDITRSLGAVRRSVSRIISAWQKEGVVEQQDRRWVLLRPEVLEELAAPIRHSLNYQMGMSLAPLDQKRARLARASLEIAAGHPRWIGRSFEVDEELIIGRQPPASLLLPSELVSPQHCRVFRAATGGRFWIEDMESLNGCELNDRPVKLNVLKDGDQIKVGGFTLTFRGSR